MRPRRIVPSDAAIDADEFMAARRHHEHVFELALPGGGETAMVRELQYDLIGDHIVHVEFQSTFFPFVIGHGSFELTAIVLCGAAGFELAFALIAPGRLTRVRALRAAAAKAIQIVYGAAGMLLVAAFIEAFWSSKQTIPIEVKYSVGSALWVLVLAYLTLVGRRRGS